MAISGRRHFRFFARNVNWLMEEINADTVFLRNRLQGPTIAVLGTGGPYDSLKIAIANRIARSGDGTIQFLQLVPEKTTETQIQSIKP